MLTRRALLGAGAVAGLGLAGCGPPDQPTVDSQQVLDEQLLASQRALAAYESGPMRERAAARVKRLEAAGATRGSVPSGPTGPEAALAAERAALQAHVAAVGLLSDRASRELFAGLIAGTAQAESELLSRLDQRPLQTAFPGQPANPR
jgi:hypothetical protein